MAADAECYQKTVDDRTIILNLRSWYSHPFLAGDWLDLRFGFFLSLTQPVADDATTGLGETMGLPDIIGPHDRYFIGVSKNHPGTGGPLRRPLPRRPGQPPVPPPSPASVFIGFTNATGRFPGIHTGDSLLVNSDAGAGAGTQYWRPANSLNSGWGAAIFEETTARAVIRDNVQQHFPADAGTVAAGYATFLAIQLLRDTVDLKTVTVKLKSSVKSGDWFFSNTPTKESIQATLAQPWPPSVQMGPIAMGDLPNAFYFYWPFRKSRLRIHSIGLLRAA